MRILTTINWNIDKVIEYVKPKTKRHKRKFEFVFNTGIFFRIEGCDLINIKYLTELFTPYLNISKATIIIDVKDFCEYNWKSRDPIKDYRLDYKIYINGINLYKFSEYFIDGYSPVKGVRLEKIKTIDDSDYDKDILNSMWNKGVIEVRGNDSILGFATCSSLELKSAQSLSICKDCCNYKHHSYGWLTSNDTFCEVHPSRHTYNLVECPSFNIPDALIQKPLCYSCKYYNSKKEYFKQYLGCAVHPEHKKYDLMECSDYAELT